ncbi:MAG: anthranilate phosphoribosyltransferase, partial [Gemmatimonadota bacterium]|nr:anthranilate phosphoribosyltransferase [Gemmatimonadota bacterium]
PWSFDPTDAGLELEGGAEALAGGSPEQNARTVLRILEGDRRGAARTAALLNAAAAIYVAREEVDFGEALRTAERSLDEGAALHRLETLRTASHA